MPRSKRKLISQTDGSIHLISRVAGGDIIFYDEEKEYLLELIERFALGFFVEIHAYCIMGNHFHILATGLDLVAKHVSEQELLERYRFIYGKEAEPPAGSYAENGEIIPDADEGIERLRRRLSSISCFMQELKQTFSRWYNKKYQRKGYLWGDRFRGVIISPEEAELSSSIYIDLNPVRAGIVKKPEDYPWSSIGLRIMQPKRAEILLKPLISVVESTEGKKAKRSLDHSVIDIKEISAYRKLVYLAGGVESEGKASITKSLVDAVVVYHGKLGIGDRFRYRIRNFSYGIAIGGHGLISRIQEEGKRKFIRPRAFLDNAWSFATRALR